MGHIQHLSLESLVKMDHFQKEPPLNKSDNQKRSIVVMMFLLNDHDLGIVIALADKLFQAEIRLCPLWSKSGQT